MSIVITDEKRWDYLTRKICKAQIVLERLKSAVKIGNKNIRRLREEKESLKVSQKQNEKNEKQN